MYNQLLASIPGDDMWNGIRARHDKQHQTGGRVTSLLYGSAQFFGVSLEHMELPRPVWGRTSFVIMAVMSVLGSLISFVLFLRTKKFYATLVAKRILK
ncbi:hypothetical protein F2Q70_00025147 [Brassica cretica]|uniref:Uncharacterized protein n=1 Tax=Brassica cretica TaxID=69181 RepID=A0A8S9LF38_BRACR|nr:hypothetical protein F2Q70_00025147 [Brassica cretica]